MQARLTKRFLVYRTQLTLIATRRTPHVSLRAWCKQCLPGRWKPGVLRPGIVGMQGSMVIYTTTAMHDNEYIPVPLLFWSFFSRDFVPT